MATSDDLADTQRKTKLAADFENPARETWLKLVDKALKGGDFEKRLVSHTADGLRIEPLYTRKDEHPGAASAIPGEAPFTRGVHKSVEGQGWDIRQLHVDPDAKSINEAILNDLNAGVSSVTIQIAAPGQIGLEPSVKALSQALKDVRLDWAPIAFASGSRFTELQENLHAVITERGFPKDDIRVALNADPLGELARTGTLPETLKAMCKQLSGAITQAQQHYPNMRVVLADARPYHEAGATQAQELACLAASLVTYLRELEANGATLADTLKTTAFALSAESDIFLTIAKLRAARRIISRIADSAGPPEAAGNIHITASTSERMMTKRDPWTNLLRTTTACAAAALGGADAITVLPFTWALGTPDFFALRTARNTHMVCQEEASLGRVIDPAGGSWYVENLTEDLAQKAWELFQEIEAEGGLEASLNKGAIQERVAAAANERAKRTATGREPLTGTSTFPLLGDDGVTAQPHPEASKPTTAQIIRPLTPHRLAEPFEALRDAADAFEAISGSPPKVFLASLGTIADHTNRSTWMKNLLAAGGIHAITTEGFKTPAEATEAFATSGAKVACICSSDALYAPHAEATAKALKAAGASHIYLAGRPGEQDKALQSAGLTGYLYAGRDAVTELNAIHKALNVSV